MDNESMREKFIERLLKDANIGEGDSIEIEKEGDKKQGILMPHHAFSDDDVITVKLENGYNIGIEVDENTKIRLLKKYEKKEKLSKEILHPGPPLSMKEHVSIFKKIYKRTITKNKKVYAKVKRKYLEPKRLLKDLTKDKYVKDRVNKINL